MHITRGTCRHALASTIAAAITTIAFGGSSYALGPVSEAATQAATPQPQGLEELYATVESGVLSVVTTSCDGGMGGSAFLVAPNEVVTAAHVVRGAVSVAVDDGATTVGGVVLGLDESADVALVRLDRPLDGHVFTMSAAAPRPGASVVTIGFPLGSLKSITSGTVSGVERTVTGPSGTPVSHLIQMDVPVSPGSSGSPLLDVSGAVVGVVAGSRNDEEAQGLNYAASATFALTLIDAWRVQPQPPSAPGCDVPLGPQPPTGEVVAGPDAAGDPVIAAAMDTFSIYFGAINAGFYEDARQRVLPAKRHPPDAFADALSTTYDLNIRVWAVLQTSEGATAWVTFTSLQAPDKGTRRGEACTLWSIDYTLVPADDGLMWIASAVGHAGGPISQPC